MHQIPDKPGYLRVKVWRRLQRLGAVAVKNSVYVLPRSEQAREHLHWVLREIVGAGGDATMVEARFIDGMNEEEVEGLFRAAREADFAEIAERARAITAQLGGRKKLDDETRDGLLGEAARLKRRLAEVLEIDFFGAMGREAAEGLIAALERRLGSGAANVADRKLLRRDDFRGCTWVTRTGIHVDRIASAWLIKRFIDPDAVFKFVPGKGYRPATDEIRFDMFDAEFTHEGDSCTFEVLLSRFGLDDAALRQIAEIVHDIDLKDDKFARPDTPGVDRLILGITFGAAEDELRLERGSVLFESLYAYFKRKSAARERASS